MLLLCAFTGCKNPLAEIIARDLTLSEIHIFSGASEISNGSEYSRNIATGSLDTSVSFTIKNQGERALCLTENPVTLTGSDADSFTITQPETLDLARQENCGFSVSVIDTSSPVLLSAEIRIASDDSYFPEFLVYLKVSVADIHVTGVEVSPSRIVLDPAGTCQLSAALQPSDATHQGYSWTSDSESVVTVDADGEITAVSQGQTTVTATTDDGSYTDSCSVLVRGWETSEHITEAVTSRIVYHPRIASNDSGTFFAVWYEQRSGDTSVYANRYTPGGGWGTAQPIEAGSGDAFDPDICTDGSGNALALWLQDDGTRVNVMSSAYTAGTGWGSEDAIETSDITATTPTIVMNDSGDAAAVWLHYDGSTYDLWTNLYTPSSGWGTSESLESGTWDVITSDAAIDSAGNVFVVWFQQSAASVGHIYARRYNSGTEEWEPAETIEADEDNSPGIRKLPWMISEMQSLSGTSSTLLVTAIYGPADISREPGGNPPN